MPPHTEFLDACVIHATQLQSGSSSIAPRTLSLAQDYCLPLGSEHKKCRENGVIGKKQNYARSMKQDFRLDLQTPAAASARGAADSACILSE